MWLATGEEVNAMPNAERYKDVPALPRAFLEQLSTEQVHALLRTMRVMEELPDDAIKFLIRSNPETLEFLTGARPEEIELLSEGLGLVRSFKTVGRFMKIALVTLIGAFVAVVTFGESVKTFMAWFRLGGGK